MPRGQSPLKPPQTGRSLQGSMQAQKWLNAFVRFVAFLERVGNALGTLAFIWATVVVLGGFITNLMRKDFGFATAIVFLEAFRAFSRQSMPDDQLLFKTTGGIKLKRVSLRGGSLYYVNAVIMTVCLCLIPGYLIIDRYVHLLRNYHSFFFLTFLALVSSLRFYHFIMFLSKPGSPKLLQFSPFAALLAVYVLLSLFYSPDTALSWRAYLIIPQWFIVYLLARVHYQGAAHRSRKRLTMAVEVLRVICLASIILTLSTWWLWLAKSSFSQRVSTWYPLLLLGLLGAPVLGNLQTLVALARILLSCRGLFKRTEELVFNTENTHVLAALRVLYIMVLFQGILYMTACILESCSTLLRRSVALRCGLVDTLGWQSVNLYYQHAYDKFLQESVFDTTEINLSTFAVHSLSCDVSRDKKLAALRILHSFLRQEARDSKTKLISEITTSTKAVTSLISMLGWTVPEVAETRLLAAKVTAHLAPYLQIVQIPGTMQMVSTLLDEETQQAQIMDTNAGNHGVSTSSRLDIDIEEEDYDPSTRAASMSSQILRLWQHLNILRSIPHDGPKGIDDSLPALGMLILQGLAHNPDNCIEISTATELIPKIIGSMSCATNTMTPKQKHIVTTASLTLVAKLAIVKGKVGIVLRQELCEDPFLLSYIASIMEDSSSGLEQLKPTIDIIATLAVDRKTRQEIGRIQVIMHKLVQEFLRRDESFKTLRTAAGEALAMLAMESVDNCRAILVQGKPEYPLMDNLQAMLAIDECLYPAASLLQSLCANCEDQLGQSNNLPSTLEVVLEKIMHARGKQMEALVGLASEIYKILPKRITPALESCPNVEAFVRKLVGELNAHKKPSPGFPSMRRLLLELTICMAESCPSYADTFKKYGMKDALSEVENTPSKVESYRVLFGSVGVVSQEGLPLSVLVTRAKELLEGATQ